jgi:hypothetical protein
MGPARVSGIHTCAGQRYADGMSTPPVPASDPKNHQPPDPWRWMTLLMRIFILGTIAAIYYFLTHLFVGGDEFTELPGPQASERLGADWPTEVDPTAVLAVSFKLESSIDSYSAWYRIQLSPESAAAWQNAQHARKEQEVKTRKDNDGEGLHLVIAGPPALRNHTGTTPAWWTPPAIPFRATEAMLWYREYDSGVGRALYSGFDSSTDTLWIYDYSCQHDRLWDRGKMPQGKHFMTLAGARDDSSGTSPLVIRVGDTLDGAIQKLQEQGITVSHSTPAIAWADGRNRKLYQLSRSRSPTDALVLVALEADGSGSVIEEIYWEIEFSKQHVPQSERPPERREVVESVDLSELTVELIEPARHSIDEDLENEK